MKFSTSLRQIARLLSAKPTRRSSGRFATGLERLECRLNLAAVLVIETTDAYWLYDDVDALVAATDNGSAADSSPSEPSSEFTNQELQVIEELVAELIATEGYSEYDILAITYLEDTTSDELLASGFFEDVLFDEDFAGGFETFADFGDDFETTDLVDATDDLVADLDDVTQLPGAAGNDVVSSGIEALAPDGPSQLPAATEQLTANVLAFSADATDDQSQVVRHFARLRNGDARSDAALPVARADNAAATAPAQAVAVVTAPMARAMAMIQPMASAAQFAMPFAKFATTGLVAAGMVIEHGPAHAILMSARSSMTDGDTTASADGTDGLSYSQITALFGAGGLAAAHWWNVTRNPDSPSHTETKQRRRLRERRATI